MSLPSRIEYFLKLSCTSSSPLLLAFSGGTDSLCLFYSLLDYRKRYGVPFHVAHVDHSWRKESQLEAEALHKFALDHSVPFHLKTLNPQLLKGNLEAACREERYTFFAFLYHQNNFQAVLTAHHKDDQTETVFKRLLEGAHWSRWAGLKSESWMHGCRILRPLLDFTKEEIARILPEQGFKPFHDPSNDNPQFFRTRLRKTVFPELNRAFGKNILSNIIEIREEMSELVFYFESRLEPFLNRIISGPWGMFIDLKDCLLPKVEIKYLIRLLSLKFNFFLSREIIAQAATAFIEGKANQQFVMNGKLLRIDRYCIFVMPQENKQVIEPLQLRLGNQNIGQWKLNIEEVIYSLSLPITSWKEGWQGSLTSYLPLGNYHLNFIQKEEGVKSVKKKWSQAKIPAFLYSLFPVIRDNDGKISHEFLTGKPIIHLKEGEICWKIELKY